MKGLPIARLPVLTAGSSPLYVVTVADRGGRLADRAPLRHLGWGPGTRLHIRLLDDMSLYVKPGPGADAVTPQGHLRLPLPVRRLCHIEAGTRLVVVAWTDSASLTVCRTSALDVVLRPRPVTDQGETPGG